MVFILNDFFVPTIDVLKDTGTCGDQAISRSECAAYAGKWVDLQLVSDKNYPSGCLKIAFGYEFNSMTTNVPCGDTSQTDPSKCVCRKGKSEIN